MAGDNFEKGYRHDNNMDDWFKFLDKAVEFFDLKQRLCRIEDKLDRLLHGRGDWNLKEEQQVKDKIEHLGGVVETPTPAETTPPVV